MFTEHSLTLQKGGQACGATRRPGLTERNAILPQGQPFLSCEKKKKLHQASHSFKISKRLASFTRQVNKFSLS